jgi:hypothetical protein
MRRIIIVLGVSLAPLLGLGIVSTSAQDLTQTDRQGPVLVAVTLSKAPTMGTPTEVKVVLAWISTEGSLPNTLAAKARRHHALTRSAAEAGRSTKGLGSACRADRTP